MTILELNLLNCILQWHNHFKEENLSKTLIGVFTGRIIYKLECLYTYLCFVSRAKKKILTRKALLHFKILKLKKNLN